MNDVAAPATLSAFETRIKRCLEGDTKTPIPLQDAIRLIARLVEDRSIPREKLWGELRQHLSTHFIHSHYVGICSRIETFANVLIGRESRPLNLVERTRRTIAEDSYYIGKGAGKAMELIARHIARMPRRVLEHS